MKKNAILILFLFVLLPINALAYSLDVSPATIGVPVYPTDPQLINVSWVDDGNTNAEVVMFDGADNTTIAYFNNALNPYIDYDISGDCNNQTCNDGDTLTFLLVDISDPNYSTDCESGNIATCQASTAYLGFTDTILIHNLNVGIPALTNTASVAFSGAMGFDWQDVVDFTGDNVKIIVGSGFGILSAMIPWIIAIAVIMLFISFIYVAFKFFRH